MGADSRIEWCDDTVNPWWGCQKVSPACTSCYAESLDARFHPAATPRGEPAVASHWGPAAPRMFRVEKALGELRRSIARARATGEARRVFVASMADVFEDRVDVAEARLAFLRGARRLAGATPPPVCLLLLTKRPDVMAAWADEYGWEPWWWAGTTVEDQRRAGERIPHLLRVPAAVRFVSCEPLLGALDLSLYLGACHDAEGGNSWLIAGGESGPRARPMHPDWARSLRDQCQEAGVPFHFKQWGEWRPVGHTSSWSGRDDIPRREHTWIAEDGRKVGEGQHRVAKVGKKAAGRLLDGRTWDEVPGVQQGSVDEEEPTP